MRISRILLITGYRAETMKRLNWNIFKSNITEACEELRKIG